MKRTYIIGASILVALTFLVITVLLFRSQPSPGQSRIMTAADRLYEAGHYAEAARLYRQLADQGFVDSRLYYNLGTAYYQQGDTANAWIALEKASRLAPRDVDIRANLVQARQALGFSAEPVHPGWLGRVADLSGRWLTRDEMAVMALCLWLALGLLVVVWRGLSRESLRQIMRPAIVIVAALVLLFGVALSSNMLIDDAIPAMVIPSHLVETSVTPGT